MDTESQHEMKWPSKRVPKGGIFNLPKVKYSKETHEFLNCKLQAIQLLPKLWLIFALIFAQLSNSVDGGAKVEYFAKK